MKHGVNTETLHWTSNLKVFHIFLKAPIKLKLLTRWNAVLAPKHNTGL